MKKLLVYLFILIITYRTQPTFSEEWIRVEGYVFNENGKALNKVKVTTKEKHAKYKTKTNSSGHYYLNLKQQKYTLKYKKTGYKTQKKDIDLSLATSTTYLEDTILSPIPPEVDLTGTWEGYYKIPELNYRTDVTLVLEQNGNAVEGEAQTSDGCPGEVKGTIQGDKLAFKVHGEKTAQCCESDMDGDSTINNSGNYMSFTFDLTDHCYGKFRGKGEAWKKE